MAPSVMAAVLVPALALVAPGCDGDGKSSGPASASRSRSEAVEAAKPATVAPKDFCETWHEADAAPTLTLPPLRAPAPDKGASQRSRWINVWATWCKPCIEELPRLAKWQGELGSKADFELWFLSADGDPEAVAAFAEQHPEVAPPNTTLELQEASALQPWAETLGVEGQAVLPIHVFVDGKDRVRCIRTAGVGEDDRGAIEQLLMSL
ncbi:TlpA family protein disulfide reductase [Paraliomyxa miuraensis]|uniref:TlpA family protein disulfide reductase n=1 Tax=Paraliomyxa miuraensis TaxID=376150 RepID=UPI00225A1E3B|nr:TlpA family protein disulfide reductase [Paraliomyxa miuraensis]MCX4243448.1 TlpA family protein disulfide reductase [Paraliomyxa miuraensis]